MYQENITALKKDAPIGVFDSGIGGLTVAREIMRQIPNEKIIYFGDTARMPYGSKSKETVTGFSKQIVRFLETFQVKTIVVACNTASAYALDELEKELDIPIIGVIKPGAKTAAEVTRNGRIGVIATEATIGSQMYNKYIQELNKNVTIYGKACPLFVPQLNSRNTIESPDIERDCIFFKPERPEREVSRVDVTLCSTSSGPALS